jgi:purine-nucleoside phosphorylase
MRFEKAVEALSFIKSKTDFEPEFGFILGTGLGDLADEIQVVCQFDYADIPHFAISTVESHKGKLIFGFLAGRKVVAMAGRFHYYEGYSAAEVTFPVIVLKKLGIKRLFISNAAGSVNPDIHAGDLVIIRDHINLTPDNPLRGVNDDRLGPRFPDMLHAYDREGNQRIRKIAEGMGIKLHEGVYLGLQGPNMETPAEYKFAHLLGADVLGMSTVAEVIMAKYVSLPLFVFSIATNRCYPLDEIGVSSVEEVIKMAQESGKSLSKLIKEILPSL